MNLDKQDLVFLVPERFGSLGKPNKFSNWTQFHVLSPSNIHEYCTYRNYTQRMRDTVDRSYILLSDVPHPQYYFRALAHFRDNLYLYTGKVAGTPEYVTAAKDLPFRWSACGAAARIQTLAHRDVVRLLTKINVDDLFPFTAGGFETSKIFQTLDTA